jgi:hypothetical protein
MQAASLGLIMAYSSLESQHISIAIPVTNVAPGEQENFGREIKVPKTSNLRPKSFYHLG